jgi:hypothetical protein
MDIGTPGVVQAIERSRLDEGSEERRARCADCTIAAAVSWRSGVLPRGANQGLLTA